MMQYSVIFASRVDAQLLEHVEFFARYPRSKSVPHRIC